MNHLATALPDFEHFEVPYIQDLSSPYVFDNDFYCRFLDRQSGIAFDYLESPISILPLPVDCILNRSLRCYKRATLFGLIFTLFEERIDSLDFLRLNRRGNSAIWTLNLVPLLSRLCERKTSL